MTTLSENRRTRFDYDILDTCEAGVALLGHEVKAVKHGQMSLAGAFVTFHRGEAYLTNAHIGRYREAGPLPEYDPTRSRRLLLHQKELRSLVGQAHEKGLTIVPLSVYTKGRYVKIAIALARGRQKYDKREAIKKREVSRELKHHLN